MGVSRNAEQLHQKLVAAEKAVSETGERRSLLPVAQAVEQVMTRTAAQAGLRRGSRIAGRPWRGVYTRNEGAKHLAVGYASPAHLVNNRTRPHIVGARKLGTRKAINKRVTGASLVSMLSGRGIASSFLPRDIAGGARALHWGNNFAAYVHSPGTHGKRFYERALPQAQQEGGRAMSATVTRTLSRVFA